MSNLSSQVCEWLEQGFITKEQANRLYCDLSPRPSAASWRTLFSTILLWLGTFSFVSGVIFFFAYNWQSLGRFAKFALIEVAILLTITLFAWLYSRAACRVSAADSYPYKSSHFGVTTANAMLLGASILVGGLLALVGQTYQTGADPWQLFALWAIVILPFAWVARFDALWLLIVGLFNLSLGLFFDTFSHFWGDFWDEQALLFTFVMFNLVIYYTFVFLDRKATGRWHAPLIEYACSMFAMGCFTWLITWLIFENLFHPDGAGTWIICGYFAHLVLGFVIFRYRLPRIYPLSLGGFSLIAVGAALLVRLMFEGRDPIGGFLFIGLYIILASTGLSLWLKELSRKLKLQSELQSETISEPISKHEPISELAPEPVLEADPEPLAIATQGKEGDIVSTATSADLSLIKQWQIWYAEGKVSTDKMPEHHDIPWYIATMQAFAAWIAALFLLGFMMALFGSIFERVEDDVVLFIGLTCLAVGIGLYFLPRQQIFIEQLAFAACLSGLISVAWGLYDLIDNDFSLNWYLCMAGISLLLWGLIAHGVAQFVFAFCLGWCVIGLMAKFELLNFSPSFFVLIISLVLFNINRFGRHYRRARMLIYSFVLALLSLQLMHAFSMDSIFEALFSPWQQSLRFTLLHLSIILGICGFLLVTIFRERQQSLMSFCALACVIGLVFVSGLSLPMQGVSTAILLMLLGHYANEFWLKWMGIASVVLFVGGYYYSLETTLMLKSWYLMGLGSLLLVAKLLMWRLFPAYVNAKETM